MRKILIKNLCILFYFFFRSLNENHDHYDNEINIDFLDEENINSSILETEILKCFKRLKLINAQLTIAFSMNT